MNLKNILAPVQRDDGCSFFRIETPARYLRDRFNINTPQYKINKFSPSPLLTGIKPIDRISGSIWDRMKLKERVAMVDSQLTNEAIWISRSLMSFKNSADQKAKNIIYDVDDAVWFNGEANHCFEHHCREALVVLAGNSFIANEASKFSSKVEIVPTSVDLTYHVNAGYEKDTFNVGWIGSAAGLSYLNDIADELIPFFEKHSDARLVIVTERMPEELTSLHKYIDYIPWTRSGEIDSLNQFTIGIMPLRSTDWEKGKCSFKMLQYMGCCVPVVVSPVGMNVEVMKHEEMFGIFGRVAEKNWTEVLEYYYHVGHNSLKEQGQSGRDVVAAHYSTSVISSSIASHFSRYL